MKTTSYKKDATIHRSGDFLSQLDVIISGKVKSVSDFCESTIDKGHILGITDCYAGTFCCDYIAEEDCIIYSYPYTIPSDIEQLVHENQDACVSIITDVAKQILKATNVISDFIDESAMLYHYILETSETYYSFCKKYNLNEVPFFDFEPLELYSYQELLSEWRIRYYKQVVSLPSESKKIFFGASPAIAVGTLLNDSKYFSELVSMCKNITQYKTNLSRLLINHEKEDILSYFIDLNNRLHLIQKDTLEIQEYINELFSYAQDNELPIPSEVLGTRMDDFCQTLNSNLAAKKLEETTSKTTQEVSTLSSNSLDLILDYADLSTEKKESFKTLVENYKNLAKGHSTDDEARRLRRGISEEFFDIYEACFLNSLHSKSIPGVLKMFFCFGYMDEHFVSPENLKLLHYKAETIFSQSPSSVFTIYQWLTLIYEGKREPSRNEFDLDYPAYLLTQKRSGEITEVEYKNLLDDLRNKLHFEIRNVFTITNKITYGNISSYLPLFTETNLYQTLDSIYLSEEQINQVFQTITNVDFSAFYREMPFVDAEDTENKLQLQEKAMPEVILLPNVGSRGVLWQEISDRKRNSPSRMMISIFHTENVENTLIKLTAEFRWDICKKIEGAFWNDITHKSLTSEYCDYAQYYRKSTDLSADAKEKVRDLLKSSRNNFKDMFINEYLFWIKYEANSTPRLNKVSRSIFFKYCPFSYEIRSKLINHPIYKPNIDAYNLINQKTSRKLDNLITRYQKANRQVPERLLEYQRFLKY